MAKARSEAKAKRAMLKARKSHRMMLYLPEKGANFKDIMAKFNWEIDKTYNDGNCKVMYRSPLALARIRVKLNSKTDMKTCGDQENDGAAKMCCF